MRAKTLSFLGKINFGKLFAVFFISALLVLANSHNLSASDVSANLTITDAKLYRWNNKDYELSVTNGIPSTSFHAEIDWRYESESPIADGDTASFAFGTASDLDGTRYHVRNSKDLPIMDENGGLLGYWNITNRRINIRFTGAAVGHYILEGHIATSSDSTGIYGVVASDKVVSFLIADKRISFTKKASALTALGDSQGFSNLATNGVLYWSYYTPGITSNEFYKGNGQTPLSDKAKFTNLSYETTLSELATGVASISICALAQLPLDPNDATAGAASTGQWIGVTKLFTRKYQTAGQSYEDFFASLSDGEYGVYKDENGRFKVAVKFGSQPSNITYTQAIAAAGYGTKRVGELYESMPEVKDTMNLLDTPGTVTDGKVLRFVVEIGEQIPAGSGGTRLSVNSDYAYSDEDGDDIASNKTTTVTVPVGTATASIIGEARLHLVDENTGAPLPGREFILQEQDGDEWKDLENTRRTTDANGYIQVIGLTPGKNYRWQQINFADHYDRDSLKIKQDQQAMRRGAPTDDSNFTMPTNAGISFTATNALQTYRITYQLGTGSTDDDIVFTQAYGETTKQPDIATINVLDGYTFEGWDRNIEPTVTDNTTYVARWSAVLGARRTPPNTEPESVNSVENPESPVTYDGLSRYVAILICSLVLSLYFAPSILRAYRIKRYRKDS